MRIRYLGTHDPHANSMTANKPIPVRECVVLEASPRLTTIVDRDRGPAHVSLPWMYFLVAYDGVPGGFKFHGYYHYSLRLLMSDERLNSLNQQLKCSRYDYNFGYVCLPHLEWDERTFKSRESLWGSVVNAWYSCKHNDSGFRNFAKLSDTVSLAYPLIDKPAGELPIARGRRR